MAETVSIKPVQVKKDRVPRSEDGVASQTAEKKAVLKRIRLTKALMVLALLLAGLLSFLATTALMHDLPSQPKPMDTGSILRPDDIAHLERRY